MLGVLGIKVLNVLIVLIVLIELDMPLVTSSAWKEGLRDSKEQLGGGGPHLDGLRESSEGF